MGWHYVSELLPLTDTLFISQMIYEYGERRGHDIDRGNLRTQIKTCPSATLSTTNSTWIEPGANLGIHGQRPATNRLSHGTALVKLILVTGLLCFTACCLMFQVGTKTLTQNRILNRFLKTPLWFPCRFPSFLVTMGATHQCSLLQVTQAASCNSRGVTSLCLHGTIRNTTAETVRRHQHHLPIKHEDEWGRSFLFTADEVATALN
jgi:hypothetical protein